MAVADRSIPWVPVPDRVSGIRDREAPSTSGRVASTRLPRAVDRADVYGRPYESVRSRETRPVL